MSIFTALEDQIAAAQRKLDAAAGGSAQASSFTDVQAGRLASIHREFPWMPSILKVSLAAMDADDDRVAAVARSVAERKILGRSTWSSPGDVVKWVARDTANVFDFVTPEKVENFVGRAKDLTVDQIAESDVNRGIARGAFAGLQTFQEEFDRTTRKAAQDVRERGWLGGLLETGKSILPSQSGGSREDFVAGQMLEGVDSGEGFFPGGEARERQAEKARSYGTINGSAITVGRLGASTVFQPGSKPYALASGLIDMVPEFFDPSVEILKAGANEIRQARRLTQEASEETVQRVARRTPEEWRREVEAVAGVVSGGLRKTTIPAAVDKWLFTNEPLIRRLADESSPTAIWRATNGKAPADVVKQLADASDPRAVLEVLRPNLGIGVDPTMFGRVNVIPSIRRQVRAFNLMPETFLPLDDAEALIRNLDNSLANANVMGKERDAILDLAFRDVVGNANPEGLFNLANVAAAAVKQSIVAHGADPVLAQQLTHWTGSYVKQARYLADESGPINLPFLQNAAGDPVAGWKPSALYQLLNRGVPLYQPQDIREIRGLTSALTRVGVRSKAVQYPVAAVDFMQNGVWKLSMMVRPAYWFRVNGEEIVRSNASAVFDNPVDWFAYAFGHRGLGDAAGNPFNIVKEADDLVERLPSLVGDELAAAQKRLDEIQEELHRGMTAFQSASARTGDKASADTPMGFRRTGIRQPVDRRVDPVAWQRGAADLLIAQSTDPILKRVANGGLLDGDGVAVARATVRRTLKDTDHYVRNLSDYADVLYRESSIEDFQRLVARDARQPESVFLASSRDLARGQGDNTGMILEFDAAGLQGRLSTTKPNWKFTYESTGGGEFIARGSGMDFWDRIRRVEVDAAVADSARYRAQFALLVDRKFTRVDLGGGRVAFVRPGTSNPPGLDGIREWLLNGTGVVFRRRLEAAFPDVDWKNPRIIDEFLDVQVKHVQMSTGEADDLRQAIVTGRLGGQPIGRAGKHPGRQEPSEALKARMQDHAIDPHAPNLMDVEVLERAGGSDPFGGILEARQAVGRVFFGELYGSASDKLARHPVFRKAYWNWIDDHLGWMSPEARAEAIENARTWGLGAGHVRRMEERAARLPAGDLDLEAADAFAKGVGLDTANDLLFDASQRGQFFDIARLVFPFGEAWKEVLTRWAKLLVGEPANIRRAQQVITGARGMDADGDGVGFFHPDPVTGQEMFTFPLSGALMDLLGTTGVTFEGSVEGLSLGTSVMPGLGPVGQFTAAAILPDVPDTDFIARILFPFGEPETTPGALSDTLWPPWAKKLFEAWNANERVDVMYANALAESVRVLASTGKYGNDENELSRLMDDARDQARVVTAMRGLIGAFAPSAPQPRFFAETSEGDVLSGLLFKAYAEYQEQENDGKIESALETFLDRFGDEAFVYLVGKSKSSVGGQQASSEYGDWERTHSDFIDKYPSIAGYFGPAVEGYDPTVYGRQMRTGRRERADVRESMREAQQILGGWVWRQARAEAGENPGANRREWLRTVRDEIKAEYPAWNPDAFPAGVIDERVRSLALAAEDPSVAGTPLAEAISTYMGARDQARQAAIDRGYGESDKAFATANRAAPLRAWLRDVASTIAAETPEFQRVFDAVLDAELKDEE